MVSADVRSNFDAAYLVHLISWLSTNARRDLILRPGEDQIIRRRYGLTRAELAYTFETTVPIIDRYLWCDPGRGTPTGPALKIQSESFAPRAKFLLDQHKRTDLPAPVRASMARVFRNISRESGGLIQNRDVVDFNAIVPAPGQIDLSALYGLQLLVRVSTEAVPAPHLGPEVKVGGVSISLLNVIPPDVQRGLNHTLFKIYHRGVTSLGTGIIEGVVFSQERSIYFEGVALAI